MASSGSIIIETIFDLGLPCEQLPTAAVSFLLAFCKVNLTATRCTYGRVPYHAMLRCSIKGIGTKPIDGAELVAG